MSEGSGVAVECPECDYQTLAFDDDPLDCPSCAGEPAGLVPIVGLEFLGNAKCKMLQEAGFYYLADIEAVDQSKLTHVEGIGNALAARLKAVASDLHTQYVLVPVEEDDG